MYLKPTYFYTDKIESLQEIGYVMAAYCSVVTSGVRKDKLITTR